jgi:hypothetical protein
MIHWGNAFGGDLEDRGLKDSGGVVSVERLNSDPQVEDLVGVETSPKDSQIRPRVCRLLEPGCRVIQPVSQLRTVVEVRLTRRVALLPALDVPFEHRKAAEAVVR